MTDKKNHSNQGERMSEVSSKLIPYPYLISAMDQYYGITPSYKKQSGTKKAQAQAQAKPSKKMRILLTTFWKYPAVGGLQNYLTMLKSGLEELGHRVDIIAPTQFERDKLTGLRKEIKKDNKQFYRDRYGCYSEKILDNDRHLYSYEMMLRDMNLERYDIFHAQDRFTANILGALNERYKKPLLFTPHGFMTHSKLKFNLIEKDSIEATYFLSLDRKAIESSSQVIILCEAFRPILKSLGAEDSQMTTVYTGINFRADNIEQKAKMLEDKTIITCISRLRPRKGHKYLFEALALLKNQLKNVDVWIVGDGVMREELENQVRALQLDNVFFLGSRTDVPELLSQSDIVVLPTTSDTLPISIIEAMFAQRAIITTNCGGIPELIQDYHSGLLTEPGNVQQLAEKLSLLLHDSTLRETVAQNARKVAKKHLTVTNMVKKIEEVYRSLL
ncbi:glycosyltransferase involved in cell wall biosynthesis [Aneurinibacillus soli]|uniref:N, N'-diacetylbacillosaminyl-diphospho-undecaprenol alpha-1,3-N-acetylgalactosaminyltransferase n=1 Tax=Aneurinibacillus soli TaxID=1500254 RepID=A0A0U5BBK6_9BACL|nr:glycosyltransferase family 4 protein [Aneurinibacillus soli]PYE64351.1 glycosyltransferase involved in cell wall biosynthesis [Aneurinibacillus soli]BAU28300.1 N, N'-diacetylbacillosaminyl-diphospho-undecaprenol alpha-1,3-N-acetylgalactosaminyltransferase [Aneurinibacillus soli]